MSAVGFFDQGIIVPASEVLPVLRELNATARDFDLVPVYQGYATSGDKVAYECRSCGSPCGQVDPDEARYLVYRTCFDCREG
jgi:hypothetical protein